MECLFWNNAREGLEKKIMDIVKKSIVQTLAEENNTKEVSTRSMSTTKK